MDNNLFHDPADAAVDDSLRRDLYADLHEDESLEDMQDRLGKEAYQEAARKILPIILGVLQFLLDARNDSGDMRFRLALASKYFGHPVYKGKSLSELCEIFNRTRAAGSAAVLQFQRATLLPELHSQKPQDTRAEYHNKRRETVCKSN